MNTSWFHPICTWQNENGLVQNESAPAYLKYIDRASYILEAFIARVFLHIAIFLKRSAQCFSWGLVLDETLLSYHNELQSS